MSSREIICQKIGMSSIFVASGEQLVVTFLRPVTLQVLGLKKREEFGYNSIVVGVGEECSPKKLNCSVQGQFKKHSLPLRRKIVELEWDGEREYEVGAFLKPEELFQEGECVKVRGISKGMGFTGAIKRWNFATSPKTHGSGYPHRFQGSLETGRGGRSPQKVWKGKKMSGHSGAEQCTIKNLKILSIDSENLLLTIKGSIPGRKNNLVRLVSLEKEKEIKKENIFRRA